jgi:hypothetical protein
MNVATLKLILTVISGVCWTIVYIEGIRVGFGQILCDPVHAGAELCLGIALHLFGFRINGVNVQKFLRSG